MLEERSLKMTMYCLSGVLDLHFKVLSAIAIAGKYF